MINLFKDKTPGNIWAISGSGAQRFQITNPGDGWVKMKSKKPGPYHVCQNGKWVEGEAPGKKMPSHEYIDLFTQEEQISITIHSQVVPQTQLWLLYLSSKGYVDTKSDMLINGMAYMVFEKLITKDRHDEILEALNA